MPDVADQLIGQTAIVTGEKDVAPVAKILKTFAAEFKIADAQDRGCRSGDFVDHGCGSFGGAAIARDFAGATARLVADTCDKLVRF